MKESLKMSPRRNYNQYYRDNNNYEENNEPVEEKTEELKEQEVVEKVEKVEEPVKTEVKEKKKVIMIELRKGRVVGGANLNVREKASTDGKIIEQLRSGQNVMIVEDANPEWYKLQTGGYVMKKFIELV